MAQIEMLPEDESQADELFKSIDMDHVKCYILILIIGWTCQIR